MASSANATPEYAAKEKVLCFHGPQMYEAKILKVDTETAPKSDEGGVRYQVHYKGWKQTWDEWVPPSRLRKYDEQILIDQRKQANDKNSGAAKNKSAKGDVAGAATSTRGAARKADTRGTKRAREDDDSPTNRKQEMKLTVPEVLKVILVDDWEAVTKSCQLVSVPRSPNVLDILEEFSKHCLTNSKLREPNLLTPTIISGLQVYFDRSLGQNLLYRFERQQYADMRKRYITGQQAPDGPEKRMSEVYGAEHLLRMLVAMPQMVAHANMDPESTSIIRDYVNELMIFLMENKDRFFQKEYENPSIHYQNVART